MTTSEILKQVRRIQVRTGRQVADPSSREGHFSWSSV